MQGSVAGNIFYTNSTMLYFIFEINPDGNAPYKRFREQQKNNFLEVHNKGKN